MAHTAARSVVAMSSGNEAAQRNSDLCKGFHLQTYRMKAQQQRGQGVARREDAANHYRRILPPILALNRHDFTSDTYVKQTAQYFINYIVYYMSFCRHAH